MLTILFDFDGTLANTTSIQIEVVREILADKYKRKFSEKEFSEILNIFRDKGPFATLLKIKISPLKYLGLIKELKEKQRLRMGEVKITKEMREAILAIKKIANIGVLSGGDKDYIGSFIKDAGLSRVFDNIYTDDKTKGKEKLLKKF